MESFSRKTLPAIKTYPLWVGLLLLSSSPPAWGGGIEAAQKSLTVPISLITIVAAAAGIIKGAIQLRKGFDSEGIATIQGSCICLFVVAALYLIVSFVSGGF